MKTTNGKHCAFKGRKVPADDRLKLRYEISSGDNGIIALMRVSTVSPFAFQTNDDFIGGRVGNFRSDAHISHRKIRIYMAGKNSFHRFRFENAGFQHCFCACATLFRRLKNKENFARTLLGPVVFQKPSYNAKSNGNMGVMSAGMHDPPTLRFIRDIVGFVQRQSIHIRAKGHNRTFAI